MLAVCAIRTQPPAFAPPSVTHLFTSLVGSVVKRPIGNGQSAERSSVEVEREGGNCPQTRMLTDHRHIICTNEILQSDNPTTLYMLCCGLTTSPLSSPRYDAWVPATNLQWLSCVILELFLDLPSTSTEHKSDKSLKDRHRVTCGKYLLPAAPNEIGESVDDCPALWTC